MGPEDEHHDQRTTPAPSTGMPVQRIAGFAVGGAGVVATIVGGVFGILAATQANEADEHCEGRFCTDEGLAMHDQANDYATASTALFIVGLAAIGAGITIVLTAPGDTRASGRLLLGPGRLVAEVRW